VYACKRSIFDGVTKQATPHKSIEIEQSGDTLAQYSKISAGIEKRETSMHSAS
jgi:hypothetical protein